MSFEQQIFQDYFIDYSKKLGSGAFGDVFRGICKSKNKYVAVKKIKDIVPNAKQIMDQQCKVMNNLKHQNVLNFLDVIQSDKGTFLIIQFCQGGGLDGEIKKKIDEMKCFLYLKQIVDGMASVNSALHIHRDLKPENILFTKGKVLKICDFGLARRVIGDDPNKMERFSAKGTPLYASPQILRSQKYSAKCDVWSTGTILVEMLTQLNPFEKATNFNTLKKIQVDETKQKGHYVLHGVYHPWFKEIISKMIVYNEEERWSFAQLQQKIDKDYSKVISSIRKMSGIETTEILKQQQGLGGKTFVNVPLAQNDIGQKVKKLKIRKVSDDSTANQGLNTIQIAEKLLTRQENKKLLGVLKTYVEFLYNRGKLFADLGSKYFQAKEVTKSNGQKFLFLFLSIGIFCKNVDFIYEIMIRSSVVTMPNGVVINYNCLDEKTKNDFKEVQKDYQNQMTKQIEKFKETVTAIYNKITSEKYAKQYAQLLSQNEHVVQLLINFHKNKCKQNVETYQKYFIQYFRKQCVENDLSKMNESYVRIYWICLNLVNIDRIVPISKFEDIYILNGIIDKSVKLPLAEIKKEIEKMH